MKNYKYSMQYSFTKLKESCGVRHLCTETFVYRIRKTVVYKICETFVYRDSCVQELERYVVVDSPNIISGSLTRVLGVHQCNVGYLGYRINRYL